jgi:hypothetical protein
MDSGTAVCRDSLTGRDVFNHPPHLYIRRQFIPECVLGCVMDVDQKSLWRYRRTMETEPFADSSIVFAPLELRSVRCCVIIHENFGKSTSARRLLMAILHQAKLLNEVKLLPYTLTLRLQDGVTRSVKVIDVRVLLNVIRGFSVDSTGNHMHSCWEERHKLSKIKLTSANGTNRISNRARF